MGKIVLLDELTINKIAAGEVIERPASVVKELVENSIDAGATNITVEIQNGGISKIRIIDNGSGMSKDDLEFAFERHATSKIRKAADLENVKSMGFRGEALASIAAIAHVELVSKTEDDNIGHKIVVEGGKILEIEDSASQKGTTITVSNLFFNTPVRYKFLKKDFTEAGYIEDAVTRIAIANPNIAIKLINGNKTIIQTNGNGDLKTVIYTIYGKEIAEGLLEVNYEYEGIKVTGAIGKPEIARNNRSYQMFFVNKRYIKDKTLSAGVEQAFKGLIPIGKYGVVVLNIEIEPNKIDVNVHPTKLEIRFQEEQKVFKAIYHSVKDTLLKGDLVKEVEREPVVEEQKLEVNQEPVKLEENQIKTEQVVEPKVETEDIKKSGFMGLFKKKEKDADEFIENYSTNTLQEIFAEKSAGQPEEVEIQTQEQKNKMEDIIEKQKELENPKVEEPTSKDFDEMYVKTFGKLPETQKIEENSNKIDVKTLKEVENISVFEEKENYNTIPKYKFIGALFSTYLVIEMKDEIYIIDQHAAHERVMYEKVKKNFYNNMEKDSQIMLLPDIIELSHKERAIVKENTDLFKKAGFIIEEFGDNTIRLIGVPSLCMDLDTKELFLEILDEIDTVAITAKQEKEDKFISTIACKAAVKANMKLTNEEVDTLMRQLLVLPNPFTCPHGRPTAIKMTRYDIERKFNRK
ncbi:dNA mismatch repair protein MutL [Clostridium sp. CAG:452]|nr:dNA mismatch repair protein MutL [Clostridium sp. CAG:452]